MESPSSGRNLWGSLQKMSSADLGHSSSTSDNNMLEQKGNYGLVSPRPSSACSSVTPVPTPPPSTGLPPKSPSSSISSKFLHASSSPSVVSRKKSRRRGGSSSKRKSRTSSGSSCCSLGSSVDEDYDQSSSHSRGSSSSHNNPIPLQSDHTLLDPGPDHLKVSGTADDFCSTADFNMVSLPSPTSVADVKNPMFFPVVEMPEHPTRDRRQIHRRARSWDAGDATSTIDSSSSKTCLQVPSIFRRQKVMSADAEIAADTQVPGESSGARMSGKEMHEKAKEILNSGDYVQAVMMFQALQKAQEERFGEWHSSVGAATHNVGVVRLRMGQAKEAEETLERAVAIRRRVLGNDHLDLAASLAKLGSARVVLQKFDEGLQVLREALRVTYKTLGRSHKTVAQILCHIACLYFEAGELFSAQATFEDALDIYKEVFPTESDRDACMTQLTEVLCNIGSIQNRRKKYAGAIDSFREALDLQRGIMGHDHPRVVATLDNLGYSFSKNKSYHQALACYNEMLASQLSHYNAFTIEGTETLKKQILMHEKLKNLDGAVKAVKKALNLIRRDYEPVPKDVVSCEIEELLASLTKKQQKQRKVRF